VVGGVLCATDVFSVSYPNILKVYVNFAAEPYLFSNRSLVIPFRKNQDSFAFECQHVDET
jgi:hypothetical protein